MIRHLCTTLSILLVLCCLSTFAKLPAKDQILDNGRIRLVFKDGELTSASMSGGTNQVRDMETFSFLHPDARVEETPVVSATLKAKGDVPKLVVQRENKLFKVRETYSLTKDSTQLKINVRMKITKPLTVGVIRLGTFHSCFGADAILFSQDRELVLANTSAMLDNARISDDFYHGFYNTQAQQGILMVVPGNRESHTSLFHTYKAMPGRFSIGTELKQGPFGEMRRLQPGDTLSTDLLILFVGKHPEQELNELFPGASVKPKQKTGLDADVRVFMDPAFHRDDNRMSLLADFTNPLSLLFYRARKQAPNTTGLKIRLNLPAELVLEKVVPFHMWIPRKIQEQPTCEITKGRRIYTLDAPETISSLANRDQFDSFKQHQLYLYLKAPAVSAIKTFNWSYQLIKDGCKDGEVYHFDGEILPWNRQNTKVPRKLKIWYAGMPIRQMVWANEAQLKDFLDLFKAIGIQALPIPETAAYMKNTFPDLKQRLKDAGFKTHAPYGFLRGKAEINLRNPVPGSVWTTLNGKAMYEGNNPQHSFCPSYLLREDTELHRQLKEDFADMEADYMWNDWEGKTFQGCYCNDCRKAFAAFAKLHLTDIMKLSPVELIRKYPLQWIQFRHHQSALMFAMFKKLANVNGKHIASGMDYLYADLDTVYPGLGRGRALFCEDPRMMKKANFDFVLPDALYSGLLAYDQLAVSAAETDLDVIVKTGSVAGVGFYTGCWVSRKLLAEHQHRPLGLDFWPRLARVTALGHVASGAQGLVLEGAPFVGQTCLEYIKLAQELAATEEDFLSGKDISQKCQFYDCSGPLKESDGDNTLGAGWITTGGSLQTFWRSRVHAHNGSYLFSFFNFDPVRTRSIRSHLPKEALDKLPGEMVLYDPASGKGIRSPKGKKTWSKSDLRQGIPQSCGPVDCVLLKLAPAQSFTPESFLKPASCIAPGRLQNPPELRQGRLEDCVEQEIENFPFK